MTSPNSTPASLSMAYSLESRGVGPMKELEAKLNGLKEHITEIMERL